MKKSYFWLLILVLLLAAGLRVRGITWGYPYLLDGDEFRVVYNGLSIYYTGEQRNTVNATMQTYPPYRGWEVALTRAVLVLTLGEGQLTPGFQMLLGRILTIGYGLSCCVLLHHLGKRLGNSGLLAAAFFATWGSIQPREARLVLADMPALCFFLLTIYASFRAKNTNWLILAWVAGILATIAKYNMGTVLLLPALVSLRALRSRFTPTLTDALLPAALISLPLVTLFVTTTQLKSVLYDFFRPESAAQYVELQASYGARLDQNTQIQYASHQAGWAGRLRMNGDLLLDYLAPVVVGLAAFGVSIAAWRRQGWVLLLAFLALLTFILISRFRALGERQLLGVMLLLIVLAGYGLTSSLNSFSGVVGAQYIAFLPILKKGMRYALCLFFATQAYVSWQKASQLEKTDSRAAVMNWFIENAPSNSRLATEAYLFELGELNGYNSPKRFEAYQVVSLTRTPPDLWACLGIDYLLAHQNYSGMGGYYGSRVPLGWSAQVQPVAEFHPPAYGYARQTIFAVQPSDTLCDNWLGFWWRASKQDQAPIEP